MLYEHNYVTPWSIVLISVCMGRRDQYLSIDTKKFIRDSVAAKIPPPRLDVLQTIVCMVRRGLKTVQPVLNTFLCSIIKGCEIFSCAYFIQQPILEYMLLSMELTATITIWSLIVLNKYPICEGNILQRPMPVLSLLRHFHSIHIRSDPCGNSLQGMSAIKWQEI